MQSNNIFLEPDEIDVDKLDHYERTQLELHGNILRRHRNPFSTDDEENDRRSSAEESYIFSLENPEA